ncbi:hypothetical protein EVAR_48080_1 [Eumeta japonica]|uniref:Uncharacterized protein n=1 Tax=Eumeta variegata TaxID=151549 RepID=A0A4C1X9S3_EUMVA|nr:hypothetical protein EVAR_48080_1 [Eumeta japonica]
MGFSNVDRSSLDLDHAPSSLSAAHRVRRRRKRAMELRRGSLKKGAQVTRPRDVTDSNQYIGRRRRPAPGARPPPATPRETIKEDEWR